jgi:hypothetical protein
LERLLSGPQPTPTPEHQAAIIEEGNPGMSRQEAELLAIISAAVRFAEREPRHLLTSSQAFMWSEPYGR